jgi:hypothetical protein
LLRARQAYELTVYFIWKVSGNAPSGGHIPAGAISAPHSVRATRRRRRRRQQTPTVGLLNELRQLARMQQMILVLLLRTRFLDVETREQGVECQLIQTTPVPQTVVRPQTGVGCVQRPTATPTPQLQTAPSTVQGTQQPIPQIPLHSLGRGRGAIIMAQLYNYQLQRHFLEYQAQQQFQQQQQNSLADLPELIPIGDVEESLEDIDED